MLRELFDLVVGNEPGRDLSEGFDGMLRYAADLAQEGIRLYWVRPADEGALEALSKRDVGLNKLERALRKEIIVDACVHPDHSVAPLLAMMSLVKDVERLGDYAKNLASLSRLSDTWPEDAVVEDLRRMSGELANFLKGLPDVLQQGDRQRATEMTREGRARQKQCKALIPRIAESEHSAGVITSLSLGAHYHKRLQAHGLNVLSSLIMPLHKLDYFDEAVLDAQKANDGR